MSKRSNDNLSISDVLKEFVDTNNLQKGLDKVNVKVVWENMMGQGVSRYTSDIKLQGTTLFVKFSSSVLREELSYGKDKIINMLNEEMGARVVSKLMLV